MLTPCHTSTARSLFAWPPFASLYRPTAPYTQPAVTPSPSQPTHARTPRGILFAPGTAHIRIRQLVHQSAGARPPIMRTAGLVEGTRGCFHAYVVGLVQICSQLVPPLPARPVRRCGFASAEAFGVQPLPNASLAASTWWECMAVLVPAEERP